MEALSINELDDFASSVRRRSSLDTRSKASDAPDSANKARLNVDEKYFNKCRRKLALCEFYSVNSLSSGKINLLVSDAVHSYTTTGAIVAVAATNCQLQITVAELQRSAYERTFFIFSSKLKLCIVWLLMVSLLKSIDV